jgi:hypothetical protein
MINVPPPFRPNTLNQVELSERELWSRMNAAICLGLSPSCDFVSFHTDARPVHGVQFSDIGLHILSCSTHAMPVTM